MNQSVTFITIDDDDLLWRRIVDVPEWFKPLPDGTYRVTSAAFKDGLNGEVSVHLKKLTTQEQILLKYPENGLVEIVASLPRELGHSVVHDPQPDDYSHSLICPPTNKGAKTRLRDAKTMALSARWLVKPKSIRD